MPKQKKTDNHSFGPKLELRKYFLRKYHTPETTHVLDCCQATGQLWKMLAKEHPLTSYWGVDIKPKKGRIKIDSVKILAQKGWPQNVVDIDTYGTPWKHWVSLLATISRPTTVFLTIGLIRMGGGGTMDTASKKILGVETLDLPPSLQGQLWEISEEYMLAKAQKIGIMIEESVEVVSTGTSRYLGIRLHP